jgi:hypothetical protein
MGGSLDGNQTQEVDLNVQQPRRKDFGWCKLNSCCFTISIKQLKSWNVQLGSTVLMEWRAQEGSASVLTLVGVLEELQPSGELGELLSRGA